MLFDLECIHCDKNGNELMPITFTNVNHIAGGNYNLASLPRMMKSGWKMTGDAKNITMRNNQLVIRFDIVIFFASPVIFQPLFIILGKLAKW